MLVKKLGNQNALCTSDMLTSEKRNPAADWAVQLASAKVPEKSKIFRLDQPIFHELQ
jgi:hypothetical protein